MRQPSEEDDELPQKNEPLRDLMCGIGPYHVRMLCETDTGWGVMRSYTPSQVGDMTLDQIMLMLCDKKLLRSSGRERVVPMTSAEAISMSQNGTMKGRTVDGQEFHAKFTGKSLTQMMREEEDAKEAREIAKRDRRKQSRGMGTEN